jgi:transcriptional regulator with XRE-family HTH domain
VTTLAELVATQRERLGLSVRQAAEKSGGRISASRLNSVEHGAIPTEDRILEGIAEALDLPLSKVRAAAGRDRAAPLPPFVLPARADRLNARERKTVQAVVDALLAAHRERS